MKIKIDNINYNNNIILRNIDITINKGDVINIIGKNGSGKSSFYRAILGQQSYKGTIDIPADKAGIISDYSSIPEELIVKDIVAFLCRHHHMSLKNEYIKNLFIKTDLNEILKTKIKNLSSGEKRKVEIFSTLFIKKDILILDELTNALDSNSKNQIMKLIIDLHNNNPEMIIFFTSHDINESMDIGGRFIFIDKDNKTMIERTPETKEEFYTNYSKIT